MIKTVYLAVKAYVRDCQHDKELKQKKWMWRWFHVYDKNFDYTSWKQGSLKQYIQKQKEQKW